MIERIVKVQEITEQGVETPDDILELSGRGPAQPVQSVETENAEADIALLVDVGMPQLRQTLDGRWAHVVVFAD